MNGLLLPKFDEAINGALLVLCGVAVVFLTEYLWRLRADFRRSRDAWSDEHKAAVGMLMMFVGLVMKVGAEWWFLHISARGVVAHYPFFVSTFLIGTLATAWGLLFMLSAISRFDWPPGVWIGVGLLAAFFGVYFAAS